MPQTDGAAARREPLLEVNRLEKHYRDSSIAGKPGIIKAVNNVSLQLYEGETYGLVGESGCGKSTLGKTIMQLLPATGGEVKFGGRDLLKLPRRELRSVRQQLQMVFQDPFTSLNPRIRIGSALEEALAIHGVGPQAEREAQVLDMFGRIGLAPDFYYRFPHELSGGQRQRIGLARALILRPKLVICDEPVSALDVIIQSQMINLMKKLQRELQLTYLFIAHDISIVRYISDRIGVMYLGKLVEEAETDQLFANPRHPYTKVLLSAIPMPNPQAKKERIRLSGELPSPLDVPGGCVFHTRCPYATEPCKQAEPQLRQASPGHAVACHLA